MHAGQRPGVLQLEATTPHRTQTVHLTIGCFQTMVFTANKPEFFSAGVPGLSWWGVGGGGFLLSVSRRLCPTRALSAQETWPGPDIGLRWPSLGWRR